MTRRDALRLVAAAPLAAILPARAQADTDAYIAEHLAPFLPGLTCGGRCACEVCDGPRDMRRMPLSRERDDVVNAQFWYTLPAAAVGNEVTKVERDLPFTGKFQPLLPSEYEVLRGPTSAHLRTHVRQLKHGGGFHTLYADVTGPGYTNVRSPGWRPNRIVLDGRDVTMRAWAAQPGERGWVAVYRQGPVGTHLCDRCQEGACSATLRGRVEVLPA